MRKLMNELRSSRHALLSAGTLIFIVIGLAAVIIQQHNNYAAVVARMDRNFARHRTETAKWFRAADHAMAVAVDRRLRLLGRMAVQSGVPQTEVDRLIEAEGPPVAAHSAGIPDSVLGAPAPPSPEVHP